jgi:hypothetical protein
VANTLAYYDMASITALNGLYYRPLGYILFEVNLFTVSCKLGHFRVLGK